jgi:hypothetical protein
MTIVKIAVEATLAEVAVDDDWFWKIFWTQKSAKDI